MESSMKDSKHTIALCTIAWLAVMPASVVAEGFWSKTFKEINNAGRDINRAAITVGKALEKAAQDVGAGAEHFGKEVTREFCDLMTLGQASQGKAGCHINAGVGVDNQGPFTYDPSKPDEKYRGTDDKTAEPVIQMTTLIQGSRTETWEYEDQDVFGISRFLPPNKTIGEAWPGADKELKPPTVSGRVRDCCNGGGGGFLATRNDRGNIRFHAGVDYLTQVGEPIYAPTSGWVERVKNPGRPGLYGVLIRNDKGYTASVYYVEPTREIRDALDNKQRFAVVAGKTIIGRAQNLHPAYPDEVPQHVHVTLTDPQGNPVAPDGRTRINKTPDSKVGDQ